MQSVVAVSDAPETSDPQKPMERMNLNILTVASLLLIVAGGAVSFGIIYEQNRRHEQTLQELVGVVETMRETIVGHSHAIDTLKESVREIKSESRRIPT